MPCSNCSSEVKLLRKGLCGKCYARLRRNGTFEYAQVNRRLGIRKCSFCNSEKGPFVKTLCKACYYRNKKNNVLEYQKLPKFCKVPSCEAISVSHGLCDMHRKRVDRSGTLETSRPPDWGAKKPHPLYLTWQSIRRASHLQSDCDLRWEDFWNFVEDVGERPTLKHRLYRLDRSKPYSKDNVEWRGPILDIPITTKQNRSAWQRAYRLRYPDRAKDSDLRKYYGVSIEHFNSLLEKQNHCCAICGNPEGAIDPNSKKPRKLALDHCHATKKPRGLLCTNCNTGLGRFNDHKELLLKAIAYLEKYQT